MKLGEIVEKMEMSNRLVVLNAAGQVVYRGYVANFFSEKKEITERDVKGYGIGLETYKKNGKSVGLDEHGKTSGIHSSKRIVQV